MKNYSEQKVLRAIQGSRGIVSKVARKLGCTWGTAQKYIALYDECKVAFKEERENLIDDAESSIVQSMEHSDGKIALDAAKWVTARLGRERGWGTEVRFAGRVSFDDLPQDFKQWTYEQFLGLAFTDEEEEPGGSPLQQ